MDSIYRTKIRTVCLLLILISVLVESCAPLIPNKTPYDYPGSVWESEDHSFYFQIEDEDPNNAIEYIAINGEKVYVVFFGDKRSKDGSIIAKTESGLGEVLFDVEWKCHENRTILYIRKDYYKGYLDNTQIVLYRIDGK